MTKEELREHHKTVHGSDEWPAIPPFSEREKAYGEGFVAGGRFALRQAAWVLEGEYAKAEDADFKGGIAHAITAIKRLTREAA
jgi:hypothetical protein